MIKKLVDVCICFFIILSISSIFINLNFFPYPPKLSGKGVFATVMLFVEGLNLNITILSPENRTYNFSIGDNYMIDLNVSSNFNVNNWWYTLQDLKHNEIVNRSVIFSPNTTIQAVRWSNKLTVYANDSGGNTANASVIFFVNVPNSAPVIKNISSNLYVCEGDYLVYYFNASDADEDILYSDISPKNPFYVIPISSNVRYDSVFEIVSGLLSKASAGGGNQGYKVYRETVYISDTEYVDQDSTNITVIEINNAPSVEDIGTQTVWTRGENNAFYKQVQVNDIEDGNQDSGNLTFNITFLSGTELFNISNKGIMNFTPNSSQVGVYNISICVNDTGIKNPHQNISLCNQSGSPLTSCINFSLTVTDENRAPNITSHYPSNLTLEILSTENLYFNITKYDPEGTIPDTYWYVDGVFKEYDSGSSYDDFTYTFGCDVSGKRTVKAEITDGLLNDSVQWNLSLSLVPCPAAPVGAGGGPTGKVCYEKWVCEDWIVCQNTKKSFETKMLSPEDYDLIKKICEKQNYDERFCGYQVRSCYDINYCDNRLLTKPKPGEMEICYYTENPSCSDKITNCHDGACEVLVDCGGPCSPCPTCSDKTQNQGEEGIDCGGPCPWKCPPAVPFMKRKEVLYITIILVLVILAIMIIEIIKIAKIKRKIKKYEKTRNL